MHKKEGETKPLHPPSPKSEKTNKQTNTLSMIGGKEHKEVGGGGNLTFWKGEILNGKRKKERKKGKRKRNHNGESPDINNGKRSHKDDFL